MLPSRFPVNTPLQGGPLRIAVLLSGGVDSSVALCRLKARGMTVQAYYLKVWLEDDAEFTASCPWEEDLQHVRAVCAQVDVSLSIVPLQQSYYERIVHYVIEELRRGATPSPDVLCNSRIKFGAFLERMEDSFDYVASGHYAQLAHHADHTSLLLSADGEKDQTYFLSHLTQVQLSSLCFPIGDTSKQEIRKEARQFHLPNHRRKDSQGICFLGKIPYAGFIAHYLGERPGKIVEKRTGKVLGRHKGYWFHTIGQRRGLGLAGGPWYVVKKQCEENIIYVAHPEELTDYGRSAFFLRDTNWIPKIPSDGPVKVKIRHSPEFLSAHFHTSTHPTITLRQKEKGIAEGQFAVLYRGDYCLGGGKITFL